MFEPELIQKWIIQATQVDVSEKCILCIILYNIDT